MLHAMSSGDSPVSEPWSGRTGPCRNATASDEGNPSVLIGTDGGCSVEVEKRALPAVRALLDVG